MARLLHHAIEEPRICAYLPGRLASLENRVMVETSPEELEQLLVRGWRRFGPTYFRPACSPCGECVSMRIPIDRFAPSKTQRRVWRRSADLRVVVDTPRVDGERLDLYHAWHSARERARGWEPSPLSPATYFAQFAFPHPAARELAFYDDTSRVPRLVGIGICDEMPFSWSAVYFFSDPNEAHRSLGVANVLFQIEIARRRGLSHVYLGFRVEGCASMRYKSSFRPYEVLAGRPALDEIPTWIACD